jgi:hypothetical protein
MESNSETDKIIEELRAEAVHNNQRVVVPREEVNDRNVDQYVYQKTSEVIQAGISAINSLASNISMGADPKEVSAMASLISATTKAIDSLNNINMQQRQASTDIELKKMDIAGKKDIVSSLPAANNILIATRDEVINKFVENKSKKTAIDMLED